MATWTMLFILEFVLFGFAAIIFVVLRLVLRESKRAGIPQGPTPRCPECGVPLPSDAPEGLCPRCLLDQDRESGGAFPAWPEAAPARPQAPSTPQPLRAATPTAAYRGPLEPPSPAELAPHFPQLEILELLGQGGMGAVYKARQVKLDRLIALKILPPEWSGEPAFAERFAREGRTLAKLNHPHIVAVHDFGEAGGLYYLIMEYVDGANLRQLMQQGRMPPEEALRIVPPLCDGLEYAHEEGIVHRDIKPENILLDRKGRVKIADFGLAKLIGQPRAVHTLTASHQVMGTLDYMAPEQRLRPLEVDHRADIYSLGVVLYELLTGELPLGRFAPPSAKAAVDARLDDVVLRALATEPDQRYQRANEVRTALELLLAGSQLAADGAGMLGEAGPDAVSISIPFKVTGEWGLMEYPGLIRFDGTTLILEYDAGYVRNCLAEKSVPFSAIQSINLNQGWLINMLTLQTSRMTALEGVPGAVHGRVHMKLSRKDSEAAEQLINAIQRKLPGRPSRLAAHTAPDPDAARRKLQWPAAALVLSGIVGYLYWVGWAIVFVDTLEKPWLGLIIVAALPATGLIAIGAIQMERLRSYGLALTAIILAMLPWSLHFVIGIPAGIWALWVLRQPDVRAAYALNAGPRRHAHERGVPFPADDPIRSPTGPVRRKVRSLLRSVHGLFFTTAGGGPSPDERPSEVQ